jgi:hypothetical protein
VDGGGVQQTLKHQEKTENHQDRVLEPLTNSAALQDDTEGLVGTWCDTVSQSCDCHVDGDRKSKITIAREYRKGDNEFKGGEKV